MWSRNRYVYKIGPFCAACNICVTRCPENAIRIENNTYRIDPAHCMACGLCYRICRAHAIYRI